MSRTLPSTDAELKRKKAPLALLPYLSTRTKKCWGSTKRGPLGSHTKTDRRWRSTCGANTSHVFWINNPEGGNSAFDGLFRVWAGFGIATSQAKLPAAITRPWLSWKAYEPLSKLLVSPLVSPIVVPYILPYITPLRSLGHSSYLSCSMPL